MFSVLQIKMSNSQDINDRFNFWPVEKRFRALFKHERLMQRIMDTNRLNCMCEDCNSLFNSHRPQELGCSECGGHNLVSGYY